MAEPIFVVFDNIYGACVYLDAWFDAMMWFGRIPHGSKPTYIRVMYQDWVRIIVVNEKNKQYYADIPHCKVLLVNCHVKELEQITEVTPVIPSDTN